MVLGSAYHEGVAKGYQHIIDTKTPPPQDLLFDTFGTSFERIRAEHFVKDEEDDVPFDEVVWDEDPGKLKDIGIELLKNYREQVMPSIVPVTVEHRIESRIGDIPVIMITDLTTPESVIDHKVKSRRFSEDDLKQNVQASAYSLAIGKPLEFHVALKGKPEIAIQKTERTSKDTAFFIRQVQFIWQAIQAGTFYPNNQGWHCSEKFCGYWGLCRHVS
jgi:broad-specificity NMP kinase